MTDARLRSCLEDLFTPTRHGFSRCLSFRKTSKKQARNHVTFVIDGCRYRIDGVQHDS